ncbi:MAG: hypothetical protein PHV68_02220 [Candidatus Gastranaerophilales bacterium]|nr:hypothetical protein [Candidatus Gastranaerophilales bacterium]
MLFFKNIYNIIDFFFRKRIKFSRKDLRILNEDKTELFKNNQKLIDKEQFFIKKYNLENLKNNSTIQNYLENLYTIDILEQNFKIKTFENTVKLLDIGSKNWFYAQGEYHFFKHFYKNMTLTGVELDAYRIYTDLHSRKDYADFYIKNLENTNYIVDNLMNINEQYDYIVWILPFIIKEPLLYWGLPLKYFQPEKLLTKAYNLLNKNGQMLIINQGKSEYDEQIKLLNKFKIPFVLKGKISSEFLSCPQERYGLIAYK